jgi:predicted ester cyclase/quercetin dioxygenase-like cupin family protein
MTPTIPRSDFAEVPRHIAIGMRTGIGMMRSTGAPRTTPPTGIWRSGRRSGSPILLVSCVLALATGLALLGLAELLMPPSAGGTAPNLEAVADAASVRRLYAGIDGALASGNLAPLDTVLAPSFVDHAAAPGRPATRIGFEQELVALRTLFPALRLTVVDLVTQGDEVVARVNAEHATPATFLDIPLPADWPVWETIDVFRLVDGRVVERWGGDAPTASLDPFPPASLTLSPDMPTLTAMRVTIAPGGTGAAPGTVGPTLYWVVSGAPAATLDAIYAPRAEVIHGPDQPDAGTPVPIAPGATVVLTAGDLVRFDDTRYTLRNPGSIPAVVLAVTTAATPLFGGTGTTGVTTVVLAAVQVIAGRSDPTEVAVGRATLAAGAGIPMHRVVGTELVSVEAGTEALTIAEGTVSTGGATAETTTLGEGDAKLVADGATEELRNNGDAPATVVVVAISPDRSDAAPAAASPGSGSA